MSEKELIKRCKKGDNDALRQLYEQYAPKMMGVCFRYVGNKDTAQDLLHDGFITAITKISSFRGEGSFEGWLRRIFVTTSLGFLRRESRLNNQTTDIDDVKTLSDQQLGAIDRLSDIELLGYIDRLPDGYRVVLNMFAVEGYTHKEIAEALGINEGTSRSQYSRARNCLQGMLEKDGVIEK